MLSDEELDRLANLGVELKQLEAVGADECDLGEQRRVAAKQRFKAKLLQYGERLIAQAREANRLRAWAQSITLGPLDPFNAPESRLHRALSFARQHGYHETDAAFTELHGMRASNASLSAEVERLRKKSDLADKVAENWSIELQACLGDDWLLCWKEANADV